MIKNTYEINPRILTSNEEYLNKGYLKKEEIEVEIENYSLTPKKSLVRKFFPFQSNPKHIEEITLTIPKKLTEKLQSFSITKGQSEKSTMECLNLELSKEFFVKSQESFYIDNYNKIAKLHNLKTEEPFTFHDECEGVIRFGINIHNTQKVAQSFNDTLVGIIKNNEDNIKPLGNNLLNPNDKEVSKPKSNKSSDQAVLNYDNFKILHPLETLLFKEAVEYMLSNKTKSILVDIFERNKDGSIGIENTKTKTHTVVLCREDFDNSNFLIIDPSNSEFSKHLGLLGVNDILSTEFEQNINIFVSPVNYKIYEQNKDIGTGYAFNKFRDCVDIAFKLAKRLNLLQDKKISFNINEKENQIFNEKEVNLVVKVITNNKVFDTDIDKSICTEKFLDYPLRGKQLNDEVKGKKIYEKESSVFKILNEKVKNLKLSIIAKTQAIEEMNYILNNIKNSSQTKEFLKKVEKAYSLINEADNLFMTQTNNQNNDISYLGEILESLNEEFSGYYQ